jgi:hypothetical protein
VKFDIYINGVRLDSWTRAQIVLDAAYNTNASFTAWTAGTGPWLTNLSKVRITGRECRPETASWGFEEANDLDAWSLAGLTSAGIDSTQSAYGMGSWALNWSDPANPAKIYRSFSPPENMHGLVFWGWLNLAYRQPTFKPQVTVQAYAHNADGTEWTSGLAVVPESSAWKAIGLRIAPTPAIEKYPTQISEWGFRLQFADPIPPALRGQLLFTIHLDSIELCGRVYPQTITLPPFHADAPAGCLLPFSPHPCQQWNSFTWADELHVKPTDSGWCPTGGLWNQFTWASELNVNPNDVQWG